MIDSSKQANYASKTESVKNRTVCRNLNIHHTYVTPKILPKLGKIKKLYSKTFQKESEPIDVPDENVKSGTTAKVSVLTVQTYKHCKHPKGKPWHIIFII